MIIRWLKPNRRWQKSDNIKYSSNKLLVKEPGIDSEKEP